MKQHIRRAGKDRPTAALQKQAQEEAMAMDVYAIVSEKIINLLEQGVVPWRRQ
jgi:antirestriction protein ArdC